MKNALTVREALKKDVPGIHELLCIYAAKQIILARSPEDIEHYLGNFIIAELDGKLCGCCAVRDFDNDLLEVRSLVVRPGLEGKGIGRAMVEAIIAGLKLKREKFCLFALTYQKEFFQKLGFHLVVKEMFPQKIWSDCSKCPKKDNCDESALVFQYDGE
ncbi:MAG: GNAT family N-acetyltransferase [Victivallaceae bacterium]|nr:GNAT family N-acetyltransferase [Victivallaceae bacterium]